MAYFGYVVDGEEYFFNTKEEMLKGFEETLVDLTKPDDIYTLTKEEVLEMTQFSVVFDSKEELEKFF